MVVVGRFIARLTRPELSGKKIEIFDATSTAVFEIGADKVSRLHMHF